MYTDDSQPYPIDPLLNQAVQQQESQNDPNAVSSKGAVGLMQTMPSTLTDPGYGVAPAKDNSPQELKRVGDDYLQAMHNKYQDHNLALMAYNWGPTNVDNWLDNGADPSKVPTETKQYLNSVDKNYQQLKNTQYAQNDSIQSDASTDENHPLSINIPNIHGNGKKSPDPNDPFAYAQAAITAKTQSPPASSTSDSTDPFAYAQAAVNQKKAEQEASPPADVGMLSSIGAGIVHGGLGVANTVLHGVGNAEDYVFGKQPHPVEMMGNALQNTIEPAYQRIAAASPYSTEAGNIGGQVLATAPILGAGGKVLGAGANALSDVPYAGTAAKFLTGGIQSNAERNAAGEVINPATLSNSLTRIGQTVPTGAANVAGFNALTGQSIGQGAAMGAALGPVGYGIGKAVSGATAAAPENSLLARAFKADKIAPGDIAARIDALGPEGSILDAGGENVRDVAKVVANVPGAGKDTISNFLVDRQMGQQDRLKDAALTGLGVPANATYEKTLQSLTDTQKAAATPHYDAAYAANQSMVSPEINSILRTPAGQKALKSAVTNMQNGRTLVGVSNPDLVEQAALTGAEPTGDGISSGLKLKTLDQVKQSLWDLEQSAKDQFGKATSDSKNISKLRTDLTKEMDNLDTTATRDKNGNITAPGRYAQARAAFADPADKKDALDAGWDFIANGSKGDPDAFANLTAAQKPFARIGAANKITDILNNTPETFNSVNRIFKTPAQRDALKSVFPDNTSFQNFQKIVDNEKTMGRTYRGAMEGSRTTPLAMAIQNTAEPSRFGNALQAAAHYGVNPGDLLGAGIALAGGGASAAAPLVFNMGGNALTKAASSRIATPETLEKVANLATSQQAAKAAIPAITPTKGIAPSTLRQNMLTNYIAGLVQQSGFMNNNLTPRQ